MFKIFNGKKEITIFAPVSGRMISIEDVPDKVFASRMMGDGMAFVFEGDTVCAPCDGKLSMVAETSHAFGMTLDNGADILVHIGLDTVNLNGQGFTKLASEGSRITKGTPVIRIDRAFMEEKGIDLTTPLVVTDMDDYTIELISSQAVSMGKTEVGKCRKK